MFIIWSVWYFHLFHILDISFTQMWFQERDSREGREYWMERGNRPDARWNSFIFHIGRWSSFAFEEILSLSQGWDKLPPQVLRAPWALDEERTEAGARGRGSSLRRTHYLRQGHCCNRIPYIEIFSPSLRQIHTLSPFRFLRRKSETGAQWRGRRGKGRGTGKG